MDAQEWDARYAVAPQWSDAPEDTAWWRLAHRISAPPWPYLLVGTALLLVLAAPALSLRIGWPDAAGSPTSTDERTAYDLLADAFCPGVNGPLVVVADLQGSGLVAPTCPPWRRASPRPGRGGGGRAGS